MMKIIGRKDEIHELDRLTQSGEPEFVAVYGRRRVGKTFLIKEYFGNCFVFYTTGVSRGSKSEQLGNFQKSLMEYGYRGTDVAPKDWHDAFSRLQEVSGIQMVVVTTVGLVRNEYSNSTVQKVVKIDELMK